MIFSSRRLNHRKALSKTLRRVLIGAYKEIITTELNQFAVAEALKTKKKGTKKRQFPNLRWIRRSGLGGVLYPLIAPEN